jgi:hypothetical protein
MAMSSRTRARPSTELLALPAAPARWLGTDVLLLTAAAILALSVFELATWLTSAPLTTLICSLACVPLALLFTAVICERRR